MKKLIGYILIIFTANSCVLTSNFLTDKKINKSDTTETDYVKIITTVDKYSKSKDWFYGKIEIENKSNFIYKFNFNQRIFIDFTMIQADWNIYPICYAPQAFLILPKKTSTWKVAWRAKGLYHKGRDISIFSDIDMKIPLN